MLIKRMKKYSEFIALAIILLLSSSIFVLTNHIGGWRAFTVMSASMEPFVKTGSLVITHQVAAKTLKKGDVITFARPTNPHQFVTHRIYKIVTSGETLSFLTKGDNNKSPDNWIVSSGSVVGTVNEIVPNLGYLLSFTQTKVGIFVFIVLPSLYVLYAESSILFALLKQRTAQKLVVKSSVFILVIGILSLFQTTKTYAFLSDTSRLKQNTFLIKLNDAACNVAPDTVIIMNSLKGSVNIVTTSNQEAEVTSTMSQTLSTTFQLSNKNQIVITH